MNSNRDDSQPTDIRDAFFDALYDIAAKDSNVIFLTADMGAMSLYRFKRDLGEQYINVGVAEQNLVGIAAGLALSGRKVFIYAIAPFITQRCYEQIKVDICGMNLPVTIIGVGVGIAYGGDGHTHHATQDIAIMRALPGMTIINPSDPILCEKAAYMAYNNAGPVYVRIDKGYISNLYSHNDKIASGIKEIKHGKDVLIITTGIIAHNAIKIAEDLSHKSINAGVLDIYMIKPIDNKKLINIIRKYDSLVTLEEHSIVGGIGSIVCEVLADNRKALPIKRFAIEDKFCNGYGDREWMHKYYGLDMESVSGSIVNWRQSLLDGKITTELSEGVSPYLELDTQGFANLFETGVDDIPDNCRDIIGRNNFQYLKLSGEELNQVILKVLKKNNSDSLSVVGQERKEVWEKGWTENLQNFKDSGYSIDELVPKYIRSNQPVRLNLDYVTPVDDNFERNFFKVYRLWLFQKYLKDVDYIFEFGCGTGHNLVVLAQLYHDKKLHGLDWADASKELVNKIAEVHKYNITASLFDMFSPKDELEIPENSAIITMGSMEQLGKKYEAFLQFILKKSPTICLHSEPICEFYDESNLIDYLFKKYHKKRGYLDGYLASLEALEAENKIKIIKSQRIKFGNMVQEGYSNIVWKPKGQ